jgi:hypothetical protein
MQAEFTAELLRQFAGGIVPAAVLLVNANALETSWFTPLLEFPI